ncbi:flagellar export chaperone FliS [Gallaecimonas kandeliae]|uniref:flagellar export chaperone FliS n=1 Tax=Gallaecimonas kandeliae TaxID=3029055 RepID=UPI0026486D77|nr:flagellar export chaperone FliS [Gallaecimonas kandeliae]WKE66721.1 flagellar export chaperone FliS [Gallaecimonas kandeliae]
MRTNIRQYQGADMDARLLEADPHQVILMLMNGVLEKMAVAKGCIERNDIQGKSKAINSAVSLISGLQGVLDFDSEPEVSQVFSNFYDLMSRKLLEASASREIAAFDELTELFTPLRNAWRDMPQEHKQEGLEKLRQKASS